MMTFEETLTPHIDPRWSFGVTVGCPEGWRQLVLDAHAKVVEIDPDYKIVQIKEKFGGLRFYVSSAKRELFQTIGEIVHEAEAESYKICERCGTRERVTTATLGKGHHWVVTLCTPCRDTQRAEVEARRVR